MILFYFHYDIVEIIQLVRGILLCILPPPPNRIEFEFIVTMVLIKSLLSSRLE